MESFHMQRHAASVQVYALQDLLHLLKPSLLRAHFGSERMEVRNYLPRWRYDFSINYQEIYNIRKYRELGTFSIRIQPFSSDGARC